MSPARGILRRASFVDTNLRLAIYVWDPGMQRWSYWFGPSVPAYVDQASASIATAVPPGSGIAILAPTGLDPRQVTVPDDSQGACA